MALSSSKCKNRKMAKSLKSETYRRLSAWLGSVWFVSRFLLIVGLAIIFVEPLTVCRLVTNRLWNIKKRTQCEHLHTQHTGAGPTPKTLNYFCLESPFFTSVLYNQKSFPLILWFWFLSLHSLHIIPKCIRLAFAVSLHRSPVNCMLTVALFVFMFSLICSFRFLCAARVVLASPVSHFIWPNFFVAPFFFSEWKMSKMKSFVVNIVGRTFPFTSLASFNSNVLYHPF